MPNWKKVITSGSDAELDNLTATSLLVGEITASGNISGSLTGSFKHLKATTIEGNSPLSIRGVSELTFGTDPGAVTFENTSLYGNPIFHGDINIYSGSAMLDEVDQVIFRSTNTQIPADGYLQLGDTATPIEIKGSTTTLSGSIYVDTTLFRTITSSVTTGTTVLYTFTDYEATHAEYKLKNGSNLRTGTVIGCWDGSNVDYTETSVRGLGNTSDASFDFTATGQLRISTSGNYEVTVIARAL